MLAAATLWGVAGIAVKFMFVSRNSDPFTLVQFRMTLTFLVAGLGLACVRPDLLKVKLSDLPLIAAYGTLGLALPQISYYWAIHESDVAVGIFLEFTAPVFTAVYEIVALKARAGWATYAVLAAAMGGSLLLLLGRPGALLATTPLGLAAGLTSALSLAASTLMGRAGVRKHNSWTLLVWGMGAGSLLWAVARPPWVALAQPPSAADWAFFGYLAVFSGAIPFGLYLIGLRYIGATPALITCTLEPVWATFLAFAILGEKLAVAQVVGCLLILGAIISLQAVPGAALAVDSETPVPAAPPGD